MGLGTMDEWMMGWALDILCFNDLGIDWNGCDSIIVG